MTDMSGTLTGVIGGLIVVVIGLVLFPVVQSFSDTAAANTTTANAALIQLIPLLWIVAVIALTIGVVVLGFKSTKSR